MTLASLSCGRPGAGNNEPLAAAIQAWRTGVGGKGKRLYMGKKLVGWTRFMAAVPIVGLFVAAIVMSVSTLIQTFVVTAEVALGEIEMQDMLVDYIECADYFLLSIVLYIMSIGLYSLFIDDRIPLPSWLEVHTLDELKEKLVSVIVVVMGVYFLGRLLHGANALDLLYMGAGIGAVVFSLAYFVRHVMVAHGGHAAEAPEEGN